MWPVKVLDLTGGNLVFLFFFFLFKLYSLTTKFHYSESGIPLSISYRVELYDPYDAALSDSDDSCSPLSNEDIHSEPGKRVTDRREISPEVSESRGTSLGHHQVFSPETASPDGPDYGSTSRPLDHRGHSSDRRIHSSSTQRFPGSYGGQTADRPEYRAEVLYCSYI